MRKLAATACLTLLLLGCENNLTEEAMIEGLYTSDWVEQAKDDDVEKRRKAVEVLGQLGPTETDKTVPALIDALSDEDVQVRLLALRSISQLGGKARKAQPAVGRAINDKDKRVVKEAITVYRQLELAKPSALNGG
jgi:HEAT repeat protein